MKEFTVFVGFKQWSCQPRLGHAPPDLAITLVTKHESSIDSGENLIALLLLLDLLHLGFARCVSCKINSVSRLPSTPEGLSAPYGDTLKSPACDIANDM